MPILRAVAVVVAVPLVAVWAIVAALSGVGGEVTRSMRGAGK